ncbi:hypothetical protein RHSIM_Rhsim06G0107400 [Rhododendron simsii]|uniref:DNA-directed DNA polymerase n=1 Tax=Rhododendron simsii TaxID=118357 RepID=A0A834GVT4_RHOSS|nr:hypothetical protein RHSIM_Rhsim06G0107400 [Rhododendron simsii]
MTLNLLAFSKNEGYRKDERPQEFANSELSPRTEVTRAHDVRHTYHVDDVTTQACGGSTEITTSFPSNPSEYFTSANQNSDISVACCENDSMGDSECVDFKELITSEACVGQPDLCVRMQIFDTDDNLCDNERLKLGDSTGKSSLSAASFQKEILGVDDCFENCGRGQHGQATDLSVPISSVSSTIDFGTNPMELVGMTFHRKPPVVDLNIIQRISLEGGGSCRGISGLPPMNSLSEAVRWGFVRWETVFPDGYCTVLSQTSEQACHSFYSCISHLIGSLTVANSGQKSNAAAMESSSPKESCRKSVPEPGLVSVKSPILGKLKQQIRGDLNAEMHPFVKDVTGKQALGDLNGVYRSESDSTKEKKTSDCMLDLSQISGPDGKSKPTPVSQIGFRDPASFGGGQQLTLLSVEVQAESRGNRMSASFKRYTFQTRKEQLNVYMLLRSNTEQDHSNPDGISDCKVCASSEEKLFNHFMNIIHSIDPDILMGLDIQGMLDNLLPEPLVSDSIQHGDLIMDDEWGRTHASGLHIGGRVVLNIWRLMCGELKLNMYTVEAVLRRRVPYIQSKLNLERMNQLDMINRTSELACVFGIDFFSVLSRGLQYHVESMLMRLVCTQNYAAISPGGQQVFVSCLTLMVSYDVFIPVDYENSKRVFWCSMSVLLRGHTVEESFEIGREIAFTVTAANPNPVTLKMEKVYHSCFLLKKKRYVGYSYESPDQVKPVFDAKGIETARKDTCGVVAKIMEQSLRIFFEHKDINKVKAYLLRQWKQILSGRVSLQEFVFAKVVQLGTYSMRASSSLPPAAIVTAKAMRTDPRAEPLYGERVPYVVVVSEPGSRLVDMVVDPLDLLAIDSPFRLNDIYYITEQIIPDSFWTSCSGLEPMVFRNAPPGTRIYCNFFGIVVVETGPWKVVCSAYHWHALSSMRGRKSRRSYKLFLPSQRRQVYFQDVWLSGTGMLLSLSLSLSLSVFDVLGKMGGSHGR